MINSLDNSANLGPCLLMLRIRLLLKNFCSFWRTFSCRRNFSHVRRNSWFCLPFGFEGSGLKKFRLKNSFLRNCCYPLFLLCDPDFGQSSSVFFCIFFQSFLFLGSFVAIVRQPVPKFLKLITSFILFGIAFLAEFRAANWLLAVHDGFLR